MKVYYEVPGRAKNFISYIDDLVLGYLRRHSPDMTPIEKTEDKDKADEIIDLMVVFERIAKGE